jgi:hypothetical protein
MLFNQGLLDSPIQRNHIPIVYNHYYYNNIRSPILLLITLNFVLFITLFIVANFILDAVGGATLEGVDATIPESDPESGSGTIYDPKDLPSSRPPKVPLHDDSYGYWWVKWLIAGLVISAVFVYRDDILPASINDFVNQIPYLAGKVQGTADAIKDLNDGTQEAINSLEIATTVAAEATSVVANQVNDLTQDVSQLVNLTDVLLGETGNIQSGVDRANQQASTQIAYLNSLFELIIESEDNSSTD